MTHAGRISLLALSFSPNEIDFLFLYRYLKSALRPKRQGTRLFNNRIPLSLAFRKQAILPQIALPRPQGLKRLQWASLCLKANASPTHLASTYPASTHPVSIHPASTHPASARLIQIGHASIRQVSTGHVSNCAGLHRSDKLWLVPSTPFMAIKPYLSLIYAFLLNAACMRRTILRFSRKKML